MIHPSAAPGLYNVTGACRVDSTPDAIRDAARALLSAGAADADMLHAAGGEIPSFIAQGVRREAAQAMASRRQAPAPCAVIGRADTSALVASAIWKSRNAASVYERLDLSAESQKSDLFPASTPTRAKFVRSCYASRLI